MLGSLQFGYNTGVINAPQKVRAERQQDSMRVPIQAWQHAPSSLSVTKWGGCAKRLLQASTYCPPRPSTMSLAKIVHPARQLTASNGIC